MTRGILRFIVMSTSNVCCKVLLSYCRCLIFVGYGVLLLLTISIIIYTTDQHMYDNIHTTTGSEKLTRNIQDNLLSVQHNHNIQKLQIQTIDNNSNSFEVAIGFVSQKKPANIAAQSGDNSPNKTAGWKYPVEVKLPFSNAVETTHRLVLPRAAYFDGRRRGKYTNATVILAHMNKSVINTNIMIACIVDEHRTNTFKVQTMKINKWIDHNHPECTHDNVMIICYNTPGRDKARVSVVYKNPDNNSEYLETESEHDLFIPDASFKSSKEDKIASGVMVCTTVFESPPYFIDWLRYQKTLGVDFVYINAQESFTSSKVFVDPFFKHLLGEGFVEMKVWKEYLSKKEIFYHSQALYYQHCLYRFQDIYEYVIMSDTDDFLIPRRMDTMGNMGLHQLLLNVFELKPSLGSVRLWWIRYYEPTLGLNFTAIQDGNVTHHLNLSSAVNEKNFKSIHKISVTLEAKVHEVAELMPGYQWSVVPDVMLYMSHVKKRRQHSRNKVRAVETQ